MEMINWVRNILVSFWLFFAYISLATTALAEDDVAPVKAPTIVIIQPRSVAAYQEAVQGFLRYLRVLSPTRFDVMIFDEPAGLYKLLDISNAENTPIRSEIRLIVTIGSRATLEISQKIQDIPIVFSMMLDSERIPSNLPNVTGVSLRIPDNLQFQMITNIFPTAKEIGVIYDAQKNEAIISHLIAEAKAMNLTIKPFPVTSQKEIPDALDRLGKEADVLLGIVDGMVYTSKTAGSIIRYTIKHQLPFIGISSSYVKAGALCALEIDPGDIGRQTAILAHKILSGTPAKELSTVTPEKIHLAVNLRTADIIGAAIPKSIREKASILYE